MSGGLALLSTPEPSRMEDPLVIALAVCLTFFIAGTVKGIIGMGLPTVAIGLLSLAMSPAQAAAILIVPSFFTNVWQGAVGAALVPLLRRLWPLLLGVALGTWAGVGLLSPENVRQTLAALGATLLVYGIVGLTRLNFTVPARAERWVAPIAGALTGLISAGTAIFVMPGVPYLHALGLQRDELVQGLGMLFTVATVALGFNLFLVGAIQASAAGLSLLALLPALGGMYLGQVLRRRFAPEVFRRCFFAGMLLLGAHLLVRALV
jgi:uncharacterized membrane protein YfcA